MRCPLAPRADGTMAIRKNHSTGSHFEELYGYSRAVEVDGRVWIAGTIGYDYETMEIAAEPGGQMRQCLENIRPVLDRMGCGFSDIVASEIYVTGRDAVGPALDVLRPVLVDCAVTVAVVRFPYDPKVQVELRPFAVIGRQVGVS